MSECSCQHIMRERKREKLGEYTSCYRQGSSSGLSFFFFFKKKDYLKTERCDKNRQVTRNRSLVTEIRFTHL